MIAGKEIYEVIAAIIPLYVSLLLGFSSVRFFHIFTADQCSGINRFVAVFAVPLLSFHFISSNNPYAMNYHFLAADSLQKIVILASLSIYHLLSPLSAASFDWTITLFSLSSLPNTLVMGIPLLRAMYGDFSASLMVQIVVLQSLLWYTLMLFFFEYRAAKSLIADQFPPEIAASIASFRVESDVISLAAAPLHAEADVAADGRLRLVVRSNNNSNSNDNSSNSKSSVTPRASNLTGVEIYSLQSSREPTPRGSSVEQSDLRSMLASAGSGSEVFMSSYMSSGGKNNWRNGNSSGLNKELHMYVWSASSASPAASEANLRNAVNTVASAADFEGMDQSSSSSSSSIGALQSENASSITKKGETNLEVEDGLKRSPGWGRFMPANGSPFLETRKLGKELEGGNHQQMPPTTVMSRLILIMVWRKLIRNPNTYSSLIGLVWSLVSFRWNIEMPAIIKGSIAILSNAGLGMAMFSLGLFMALQPKFIVCGKSVAAFSMAVRFLTGPAVIAATSIAIGVRGVLLHVAIVQAALPQGIVPFVFAKEYNCHPDILSTAVIFGMLIALPITILYYVLLGL